MTDKPKRETCCLARQKIVVGILKVLDKEDCGVDDLDIAEFVRFDLKSPLGTPVISFRYCPWCGTPRVIGTETRVTEHISNIEEVDEDEDDWSSDVDTEAWKDDS